MQTNLHKSYNNIPLHYLKQMVLVVGWLMSTFMQKRYNMQMGYNPKLHARLLNDSISL